MRFVFPFSPTQLTNPSLQKASSGAIILHLFRFSSPAGGGVAPFLTTSDVTAITSGLPPFSGVCGVVFPLLYCRGCFYFFVLFFFARGENDVLCPFNDSVDRRHIIFEDFFFETIYGQSLVFISCCKSC